jgi:hypothetical protein
LQARFLSPPDSTESLDVLVVSEKWRFALSVSCPHQQHEVSSTSGDQIQATGSNHVSTAFDEERFG